VDESSCAMIDLGEVGVVAEPLYSRHGEIRGGGPEWRGV
jgi:hypothetical protein